MRLVKLYVNDELIEKIRFPITEVGTTSTIIMTVENDLLEDIELIPFVGDRDVGVMEYPRHLRIGESGKVVWVFSPTEKRYETRKPSLSCECGFKEIVG